MKKEYLYCILSIIAVIIGFIFAISAVILQSNPCFSKSALLLISIVLILAGVVSFAVYYRKYNEIKALCSHQATVLIHWTYAPNSSKIINKIYKDQYDSNIATAILFVILSLIFCVIFAYSGGRYVLYCGYTLAFLCCLGFIVSLRFIKSYYNHLATTYADAIFGEDAIYYAGQLIKFQKSYYMLENITIEQDQESYLLFTYCVYDIDEPPAYSVAIPIPKNKLHTARYIRDFYMDLIKPE